MPELLREPARLRRRLERLERKRRADGADDTYWEAIAEGCFRLAVHRSTPVHEATGLLQRAAKIDGGNPKYPYHLGRIFLAHGRLDLAKEWFGVASRLCPTSHRIWTHISLLQRELNERFRTDQTVLTDDLRKRADSLAEQVGKGANRVDESLLSFQPRKRKEAKTKSRAAVAAGPGTSESGDGKPTSTPNVRRFQNPKSCRWSGVIDLKAEQSLESAPTQGTAGILLELLGQLRSIADERKGGLTGLAVLAVDWLVRGYPPSTIRRLIEELEIPATDPSVELMATCCRLFEVDEAELPSLLAECVHENRVPALLAAVIHERRLLWNVPRLDSLGAVFRTAERLLDRAERMDGDGREDHDELCEQAGAMVELLDRTRESKRKPLPALQVVIEKRDEPGSEADEIRQRLRDLGCQAEEFDTQFRKDRERLKELIAKSKKETLDETDLSAATSISERVKSMLARCEEAIKYLDQIKLPEELKSEKTTQERKRVKQAYVDLMTNKGRFGRDLEKLPKPGREDTTSQNDRLAAAAEQEPTDPLELLAHRLRSVESSIREDFDRAERTFADYGDGAHQLAPLNALRRSVRARKAEALYRLGRRQEARRAWLATLREDPLDAGALKNVAVCDSARGDLARQLQSWKSYVEMLYYFDIVARNPRPHAKERAAFHRDFAGAFAPRFLTEDRMDLEKVETAELGSFLASPRLAVFLGHKLLEILNERLDYHSPPILLGVDRSAREESRARARNNNHLFVDTVSELLPDRIRNAFCGITRSQIDAAFEATASTRRLTLKQDPQYSEEKERHAKWLREFVQFKVRLFTLMRDRLQSLVELPTLEWIEQLRALDSVPIGNSPEFLQQFVENWEQYVGLMGTLEDAAFTVAVNSGKQALVRPLLPKRLEADDCPKQLLQVALSCEVEAIETVKKDLGEEPFAEVLGRWLERPGADAAISSRTTEPDPEPALRELDTVHRVFGLVERRLDRAREALADAEGQETGDEEISAGELEELGERLTKTKVHVFLSPFVGRYKEIMSQAEGGIRTDSQAEQITEQLQELRRSVAALEPLIGNDDDYGKLVEAIDKNLDGLQSRAETELVNQHVVRFKALMASVKSPLSPAEGERLRGGMLALKQSVADCRGKVGGDEAIKALDDLSTAIDRVLTQLKG
jgi:tetratricopeptide (TPR) repeat protein